MILAQPLAQLHAGLVKLRLGIPHGAFHDLSDLIVLVTFHVVQHKDRTVARGQIRNRLLEADAVDRACQPPVITAVIAFNRLVLRSIHFVERNLL